MLTDMGPCDSTWLGEVRIRFWPSLDDTRLDTTRTVTDFRLCDEDKEFMEFYLIVDVVGICAPRNPNLNGVLETDLAWQTAGDLSGLSHH